MTMTLHTTTEPEQVQYLSLAELSLSPENDSLYRPVNPDDPEIIALAKSIQEHGVKEPLIVTLDLFILSGHRRYAAAKLAGLEAVPCLVEPIKRWDDLDRFTHLLREHNRQRVKGRDEQLREAVVSVDPTEAYEALIQHRRQKSTLLHFAGVKVEMGEVRRRKKISKGRRGFLEAVQKIIDDRREFWPLSDRQVHYALLNNPPLIHAGKVDSRYKNRKDDYNNLTRLLTQARFEGEISFDAIADPTRPVTVWDVHRDPGAFIGQELRDFLKGYWRDLQQSQPCHIEIVGEKNTIGSTIRPVAAEYCIPFTLGRGYSSVPPRKAMLDRFQKSGRDRLVILILTDFDPEGEDIAKTFPRSLRDDLKVSCIDPIKVALNAEQVGRYNLPPQMKAKETSSRYADFTERHGDDVFELEALPPTELQKLLRQAIDSVIDRKAFNHELDQEKADAAYLEGVRRTVHEALKGMTF